MSDQQTEMIHLSPQDLSVSVISPLVMCALGARAEMSPQRQWEIIRWICGYTSSKSQRHQLLAELHRRAPTLSERNIRHLYACRARLSIERRRALVSQCADLVLLDPNNRRDIPVYRAVASLLSEDYLEVLDERAQRVNVRLPHLQRSVVSRVVRTLGEAQEDHELDREDETHPFDVFRDVLTWAAQQLSIYEEISPKLQDVLTLGVISVSLKGNDKSSFIKKVPKLNRVQIKELLKIFTKERQKFLALEERHHAALLKTRYDAILDLAEGPDLNSLDFWGV